MAAFRATLEEVISADLIIHVRDISHPDSDAQRSDVEAVLTEIGARGEGGAPLIEAWNKIDLLGQEEAGSIHAEALRREDVVVISAVTGAGIDDLLQAATQHLQKGAKVRRLTLAADAGEAIAWLHSHGEIVSQHSEGMETEFEVRLSDTDWARFQSRHAHA